MSRVAAAPPYAHPQASHTSLPTLKHKKQQQHADTSSTSSLHYQQQLQQIITRKQQKHQQQQQEIQHTVLHTLQHLHQVAQEFTTSHSRQQRQSRQSRAQTALQQQLLVIHQYQQIAENNRKHRDTQEKLIEQQRQQQALRTDAVLYQQYKQRYEHTVKETHKRYEILRQHQQQQLHQEHLQLCGGVVERVLALAYRRLLFHRLTGLDCVPTYIWREWTRASGKTQEGTCKQEQTPETQNGDPLIRQMSALRTPLPSSVSVAPLTPRSISASVSLPIASSTTQTTSISGSSFRLSLPPNSHLSVNNLSSPDNGSFKFPSPSPSSSKAAKSGKTSSESKGGTVVGSVDLSAPKSLQDVVAEYYDVLDVLRHVHILSVQTLNDSSPLISGALDDTALTDYLQQQGEWTEIADPSTENTSSQSSETRQLFGAIIQQLVDHASGPSLPPPIPVVPHFLITVAITGKPFSGKETQAKLLADKLNLFVIDMNALVTPAIQQGASTNDSTEQQKQLYQRIQDSLNKGESLSDEILVSLIVQRICSIGNNPVTKLPYQGWILVDFPNTARQAELLERALSGFTLPCSPPTGIPVITNNPAHKRLSRVNPPPAAIPPPLPYPSALSVVLELECDNETVYRRALGRCLDSETRIHYHLDTKQPDMDTPYKHRLTQLPGQKDIELNLPHQCLAHQQHTAEMQTWGEYFDNRVTVDGQSANIDKIHQQLIHIVNSRQSNTEKSLSTSAQPFSPVAPSSLLPSFPDLELSTLLSRRYIRLETNYTSQLQSSLRALRLQRQSVLEHYALIQADVLALLNTPFDANDMEALLAFQSTYNTQLRADHRSDLVCKEEWHLRVDECCQFLEQHVTERESKWEEELARLAADGYESQQTVLLLQLYVRWMQCELDRYVASMQIIRDYTAGINNAVLQEELLKEPHHYNLPLPAAAETQQGNHTQRDRDKGDKDKKREKDMNASAKRDKSTINHSTTNSATWVLATPSVDSLATAVSALASCLWNIDQLLSSSCLPPSSSPGARNAETNASKSKSNTSVVVLPSSAKGTSSTKVSPRPNSSSQQQPKTMGQHGDNESQTAWNQQLQLLLELQNRLLLQRCSTLQSHAQQTISQLHTHAQSVLTQLQTSVSRRIQSERRLIVEWRDMVKERIEREEPLSALWISESNAARIRVDETRTVCMLPTLPADSLYEACVLQQNRAAEELVP